MIGPLDQRTPPMTPQLALRVAIVGGVALAMFAVIFFRLWFLQVLSGSKYANAAQVNVIQHVPVAAPRGDVLGLDGTAIVSSTPVPAVQIATRSLPVPVTLASIKTNPGSVSAADQSLYDRLASVLQMSTKPHTCKITVYENVPKKLSPRLAPIPCLVAQSVAQTQFANATIKTHVSPDVQAYLAERASEFPAVLTPKVYIRNYGLGSAGSQLFGTLGPISPSELHHKPYKGILQGNIVGQSGLEYQYNPELQGTNGYDGVKVNSLGQFEGYTTGRAPTQGDNLKTSIDGKLEQAGQHALEQSIAANPGATGGAFIAMNPQNGQVYAMGSAPSYDASIFTKPISDQQYKNLTAPSSNYPLLNRAIEGEGPDGSTFKVITATAALEGGVWSLGDTYYDSGQFCFPNTNPPQCKQNAGGSSYGSTDLVKAIQDSVDTFFYNLGFKLDTSPIYVPTHPNGGALQQWAARFGIGKPTGIDLPGESIGSMASPRYFHDMYQLQLDCQQGKGWYRSHPQPAGGCHIADTGDWTIGDNVNAAVGQGDVQVTPLQLAVVYSAIANGGTVVTPHVADQIQTPDGTMIQNIDPGPRGHLDLRPQYLGAIREGLRQAVLAGTSADTLGSFPQQVYGKTGTAQLGNSVSSAEDAWYACYVPATATSKPITVVVWVQHGGFGDVAAAPVAREILGQWFYGKPGKFQDGANKTL